ncbi:class I SAM-dependent methyltransferase [Thermodesulfobacteriota bacterium]
MSGRRIETKTSRTAEWTCVSRAASSLESNNCYRSDDHIALLLVPTVLKPLLHIPLVRRLFRQIFAPKGIYEYTIARTKYIDKVFKELLTEGLDQILILGAGFDTRALRFQTEAGDTRIFELDVPITQKAKLGQYTKRRLSLPMNVEFISIDFDKESLSEKFEGACIHREGRSLFVMEGLLMYLKPESVDKTFKVIEEFAGKDSVVVFDYVRASVLRQKGSYYGQKDILKSLENAGEKWHFGIEEGELEEFLIKYSLRVCEHKEPQELERIYFMDTSGEIVGRINGTHCLVKAVKSVTGVNC